MGICVLGLMVLTDTGPCLLDDGVVLMEQRKGRKGEGIGRGSLVEG